MKYYMITHGCQMNEHDSEQIAWLLEGEGYGPADQLEEADLVLINTCMVRENAEDKVFGQLGALKPWHDAKPGRVLAVSGCMMQTGPARDKIRTSYPQVDIVFGTQNIADLPDLLHQLRESGERQFQIRPGTGAAGGSAATVGPESGSVPKMQADLRASAGSRSAAAGQIQDGAPAQGLGPEKVADMTRQEGHFHRSQDYKAYVSIMKGCDNFCSYCVVPYARGREESRPPREILAEVEALAQGPCREITLLGQNVNSYGKGLGVSFPDLLEAICQIDGIDRIRFISSHPKDLSDRLIQVIADNPKIERHFHLPLQSGSDRVLKEMNRRYDRARYLDLVRKLRDQVPGISITTDIMVGFPGESEEDHQATLDLCRQAEFENAFTFIYSRRPGTRAAEREDQVDPAITSRRFQELLDVLYPIFYRKNREDIGKTVEVLFEGVSKTDPSMLSGRDSRYKLIHVKAGQEQVGQLRKVRITDANSFSLVGELI